jgi:hypothetical protein
MRAPMHVGAVRPDEVGENTEHTESRDREQQFHLRTPFRDRTELGRPV